MIVNKERIVEKIHPVPIIDKQHSGIPTKKFNNKELIDSSVDMNILYTQAAAFNQLTMYTSIR